MTPAYIKELLRKAALLAAAEGAAASSPAHGVSVTDAHLRAAMEELNEGGRLAQRLLGFRPQEGQTGAAGATGGPPGAPPGGPPRAQVPTGFPAAGAWSVVGRRSG